MSLEGTESKVIGNPVRKQHLLRSLRSNANATILFAWTLVVVAVGVTVLIERAGWSRPFQPADAYSDLVGTSLAQWWIVTLTVGMSIVAVILSAVACAANDEATRSRAWTMTLVRPGKVISGIWRAQIALDLLALVLVLPVGALAFGLGGTSLAQLAAGVAGGLAAGATFSALTIAIACRSRHLSTALATGLAAAALIFVGPVIAHSVRGSTPGDPVLAIIPVVGTADASAPLFDPVMRFCGVDGCPGGWSANDSSAVPLDRLEAQVHPWTSPLPVWAWSLGGAVIVTCASLVVARYRITRPIRE